MTDVIKRPTPAPSALLPGEKNPFDELFELQPEALELKMREWVQSNTPWRKLSGCHPELRIRVFRIIMAMATLGYRMMVTDGLRTDVEQAALYKKGRRGKADEKIVTHIDGTTRRSNHQARMPPSRFAGHACAVDMTFVGEDLKPSWDERWPWDLFGRMAKAQGLTWGGDWPTLRDKPHVELFE